RPAWVHPRGVGVGLALPSSACWNSGTASRPPTPCAVIDGSGATLRGCVICHSSSLSCPKHLVRKGGLEPPPRKGPDPKSGASANSATFAHAYKRLLHSGLSLYNRRTPD